MTTTAGPDRRDAPRPAQAPARAETAAVPHAVSAGRQVAHRRHPDLPHPQRARADRRLEALSRWWVTALLLPLLVVSEWQFRRRAADEAVGGGADVAVLVEVGVYAAVATALAVTLRRRRRRPALSRLLVLLWVAGLVQVASALWSPFGALAVVRAAQLLVVLVLLHAVATRGSRGALHRALHGFLVLSALAVAIGLALDFPAYSYLQEGRFTWLYVHPVQAGLWMSAALPVAVAYAVSGGLPRPGPRWPTGVYVLLAVVVGGALLATLTRGAMGAGLLGAFVAVWLRAPSRRRVDVVLATALPVLAVGVVAGTRLLETATRGESVEQLSSLNYRTELWSLAAARLADRPLLGYGLGASRGLFLEETGLGGGHNALVEVAVNSGLVGALTAVALVVTTVAVLRARPRALPSTRADRPLLGGLLTALLVDGVTNDAPGAPGSGGLTLLLLVVAWAVLLRREDRTDVLVSRAR